MSMVHIHVHREDLPRHTGEAISRLLNEHTDKAILFLIPGGSGLSVLPYIDTVALGGHITVSMIDDRFSRDPSVNNFLQVTNTSFYKECVAKGVKFISSLPEETDDIKATSTRWEQALHVWDTEHPTDRIVVALFGMGTDGHIAGMMPYPYDGQEFADLFERESFLTGYDAGTKNQYSLRMTVTITFLKDVIDQAFLYVNGEEKTDMVKKVMDSREVSTYPATVIHEMKNVEIYTTIDNIAY